MPSPGKGRSEMRYRGALFLLASVVILLSSVAIAAEPETSLDAAKRLAASKEPKDRAQALQLLKGLGKPGTAPGDEALARYGDLCLRFYSEGEKAGLEEAKRAFTELKEKAHSRWGLKSKVGLLRVAAAEGKRAEAIKGLDWFLSNQGKDDAFIEAAYWLGAIYAQEKDDLLQLQLALRALDYSLKLFHQHKSYYAGNLTEDDIRSKLGWVNDRINEIKAGPLKVAFEKAEKAKAAQKYDEALKLYEWIIKEDPGHDLAQLSGLRVCECTFLKKDLQGAIAKAKSFIAENPLGPWRGHAHLLIGDIYLEHQFDIANAEPEFKCVVEPEKAQPPWVAQERQRLFAGKTMPAEVKPSNDELWKTWGLVLANAHERIGILCYIRRDHDAAAAEFETSQKLSPNKTYGTDPNQGMAALADKIRHKKEIIPESLLTEPCQRTTIVLLLSSLYLEGWRDDQSMALLRRVMDGEFPKASLNQKAYAAIRVAELLFYKKDDDGAVQLLRKFEEKPFSQSGFAARAMLQLAVVTNRKGSTDEAFKYLDKCVIADPNSKYAEYALYQKAYGMYATKQYEDALRLFSVYAGRYPNSLAVREGHVAFFVDKIQKQIVQDRASR